MKKIKKLPKMNKISKQSASAKAQAEYREQHNDETPKDDDEMFTLLPGGLPKHTYKSPHKPQMMYQWPGMKTKEYGTRLRGDKIAVVSRKDEEALETLPSKSAESAWRNLVTNPKEIEAIEEPEFEQLGRAIPPSQSAVVKTSPVSLIRHTSTEVQGPFPEEWNKKPGRGAEAGEPSIPPSPSGPSPIQRRSEKVSQFQPLKQAQPSKVETVQSIAKPVSVVVKPAAISLAPTPFPSVVQPHSKTVAPAPSKPEQKQKSRSRRTVKSMRSKSKTRKESNISQAQELLKVVIDKSGGDAKRKPYKSKSQPKTFSSTNFTSFQPSQTTASEFTTYPVQTTTKRSSKDDVPFKTPQQVPQNQNQAGPAQMQQGMANTNFDMLNYSVMPARTAAFKAPFVPLCDVGTFGGEVTLDEEGNVIDCEEDGVNFSFKPRPNFATEVTFTVEPQKKPAWQKFMNIGFTPMICCNVPPFCLPDDGKTCAGQGQQGGAASPGYGHNEESSSGCSGCSGSESESGSSSGSSSSSDE